MKRNKVFQGLIPVLGLVLALAGCAKSFPDSVWMQVTNGPQPNYSNCVGGLKATFQAGSLFLDATVPISDVKNLMVARPTDAPEGTIVTLEAWCYGEDNQELGYFKLKRAWHASVANQSIFIYAPLPPDNRETCLVGAEERGAVPCVSSGLLD